MTSQTRSLLQSGIRSQRIQFVSKLELMHKYLQSAAKAQLPEYTIVPTPRVTVTQSPRDTVAQSPRDTVAQSPRDTVAQSPRDTKSETPRIRHLFFLGNLLSCPPTSRLLLVRVVHQRVVRVVHQRVSGSSTNELSGSSTNELSGSADQRVVRVGGPNVTAACPYPALRLDKLYAALIRCLVLWTVTKQFLVSCFKGLYLLAGGSDVTRGIACDSALY